MVTEFINWLIEEIDKRGWSNSELARRASVAPATVSMIISGKSNPGLDFCVGVARAFNVPPEDVLRRAGLLPGRPGHDAQTRRASYMFSRLSEDLQRYILTMMEALIEEQEQEDLEEHPETQHKSP
jgi:transcriptional regulator with XRE-family HTH domain